MPRWSVEEAEEIRTVRERCRELIAASPQWPEVVGDRKILRFLRGHGHNVDKAATMMNKFLTWRREFNVDEIRRNIVEGGLDHPFKFPHGDKILGLIPQLIITPRAFDKCGSPICVEQYNFSPAEVLSKISIQEYIVFVMHSLEYRSLVIEQLSEQRERAFLSSLTDEDMENALSPTGSLCYGVLLNTCVIRDLGAVGFEHASSQGQEIIRAVVSLSSDNYPELMRKCFMINTPWVFNALWYFIKGLLAARTLAKVSIMGTDFRTELEKEISPECIPVLVGGAYSGGMSYEPFAWDIEYLCPSASSSPSLEDYVMISVGKSPPVDHSTRGADDDEDEKSRPSLHVNQRDDELSPSVGQKAAKGFLPVGLFCPSMMGPVSAPPTKPVGAPATSGRKGEVDEVTPLALSGWI